MKILALDIGGTKTAYCITNEKADIFEEPKIIQTAQSAEKIAENIQNIIKNHKFDGLAICSAGVVHNNKIIQKPLNLPKGYEKIDFQSLSCGGFVMENDANAAAWCEYKAGAAKGKNNAVILAIGTGVGCGIICDGKLLKGKSGSAGEVSFNISGKDFAKLAKRYELEQTDCFYVKKLAQNSNIKACKVMKKWHENLFKAIKILNDLFDTQIFVLTGSLAKIADYEYLNKKIAANCFGMPPVICPAKYENNAGLKGVALLWADKYANKK